MRAVCTYCSASKDPAKGSIPAFKRYVSARIVRVQEIADREGVPFCVLSGEFGLVDWNQPLPWYDHLLLTDEVPQLVDKVTRQLVEKRITQLDYYTQSPTGDPKLAAYIQAIEKACSNAGVVLRGFILEEPKLNSGTRNWKLIMESAADARQSLIANRPKGELEFGELLALYPDDGMVYFERGGGYEAIGEATLAKADCETAEGAL